MAESEGLRCHELQLHSDHPDLLIVEEATRPVVHAVFAQSSAEVGFELGDVGLVHVLDIFLGF